jgi:hypothetical protein
MIKYFKELLSTLTLIEQHLRKISECVSTRQEGSGGRNGRVKAINTKEIVETY